MRHCEGLAECGGISMWRGEGAVAQLSDTVQCKLLWLENSSQAAKVAAREGGRRGGV